jgi:hypothetical protein
MSEINLTSVDWRRIYALPYNHFFKDELKQMRSYLELPEEGISGSQQAWAWLEKHFTEKRPQILPWFLAEPAPSDEKLWQTEVPLWKVAIYLITRYGLPLRMRSRIGLYVVTNDGKFLTNWRGLDVDFAINIKAAKLQLVITVDGVDVWTTEEQWHEVWEHWVKPLKRNLGEPIPANKRPGYGKVLQERIKRYAEWFELSEKSPGMGPAKALREWEKTYPDERGKYDISTVTKAVKEFGRLTAPKEI